MATKKSSSTKSSSSAAKKSSASKSATTGGSKEKSLTELVGALAETTGLSKDKAREVLDAHAELLISELKSNGSVQLAVSAN
jgi:hypothetical protein